MTGIVPSVSCSHKEAHDTSRLSEACDTYEKTSLGDQKLGTNKERTLLKKQVLRDIINSLWSSNGWSQSFSQTSSPSYSFCINLLVHLKKSTLFPRSQMNGPWVMSQITAEIPYNYIYIYNQALYVWGVWIRHVRKRLKWNYWSCCWIRNDNKPLL